jgi:hypothetical protein
MNTMLKSGSRYHRVISRGIQLTMMTRNSKNRWQLRSGNQLILPPCVYQATLVKATKKLVSATSTSRETACVAVWAAVFGGRFSGFGSPGRLDKYLHTRRGRCSLDVIDTRTTLRTTPLAHVQALRVNTHTRDGSVCTEYTEAAPRRLHEFIYR